MDLQNRTRFLKQILKKYQLRRWYRGSFLNLFFYRPSIRSSMIHTRTDLSFPLHIRFRNLLTRMNVYERVSERHFHETLFKEKIHTPASLVTNRSENRAVHHTSTNTVQQLRQTNTSLLRAEKLPVATRASLALPFTSQNMEEQRVSVPAPVHKTETHTRRELLYRTQIAGTHQAAQAAANAAAPAVVSSKPGEITGPIETRKPVSAALTDFDIDRLTDRVYQTLERRIRLERQRRGYSA